MSESSVSDLLQQMSAAARTESRAAAQRLVAIADLVGLRLRQDGGASDDWALDVVDEVAIEVAAALGISRGLAASHIRMPARYGCNSHTLGRPSSTATSTKRRSARWCSAPD